MIYPYQTGYQPGYPQNFPAYQSGQGMPVPTVQQPQASQQPTAQIQNGGFVSVRNINEAFNYPVAPGNAVTFRDETAPYIYEKTQGFSQLERPVFKKFRLVEETAEERPPQTGINNDVSTGQQHPVDLSEYVKTSDFEAFTAKYGDISTIVENLTREIEKIRFDVDALGDKSTKKLVQKARKDADEE